MSCRFLARERVGRPLRTGTRFIVLGVVAAFAAVIVPGGVAHADPVACQRAVAKANARYTQTRMRVLQKCEDGIAKRSTSGPCPDATASMKIANALGKAGTAISAKCGGADRTCGTSGDEPLSAIGWGNGVCPNFEAGTCNDAIGDCSDIGTCLECVGAAAVDQGIALYYDDLNLASSDPTVIGCQRAIGKNGAKFFRRKSAALRKCEDLVLAGAGSGPCPDAATAAKIAKAESSARSGICKKCGGSDRRCGGVGDLAPATIGFASFCPSVTIPGGASCGGAITNLPSLVDCIACVTEFKADCTDLVAVPGIRSYPPECNGGAPAATPTSTIAPATPTRTATPTPVPTATPGPNCGNNIVNAGEDCDGTADGACPGLCTQLCTCAVTCVLPNPIPDTLSFVTKPGGDLDSGWTGQAHDLVTVDDAPTAAARLSACDLNTSSPTCGQCSVAGPIAFPGPSKNCVCVNIGNRDASTLAPCDPEASGCGSEACQCFYGPPLPLSSGGVPVCVLSRVIPPFTGTANIANAGPHAGEGEAQVHLEARVHTGLAVDRPCPVCENDPTPRDGLKGGTCSAGPKSGQLCDVAGSSEFFGELSHDCPPTNGGNIGNLDIRFAPATTGTTMLANAGLKCTAPGFTTFDCPCDTCATALAQPCNSNADCPVGIACGGKRCIGGSKHGTACVNASECPGGSCGRPGSATKPNDCLDVVCSPNPGDTNPNDGTCEAGPADSFCNLEPFRGCGNDNDCIPQSEGGACVGCASGQVCTTENRECFLNPIVRTGTPGTQTAILAATFCIPPTTAPAVNSVGGLPGPGALALPLNIFTSGSQCGNGVLNSGEDCDPPQETACPGECQPNCQCAACGDGQVNRPSEQCDGDDDVACPGLCQPGCTCATGTCGDNTIGFGEECDGTATDGDCPPSACRAPNDPMGGCTCAPYCGDGIVNGEQCDGGASGGQCPASACRPPNDPMGECTCGPFCGNNTVDPGEDCDGSGTGICTGQCQADCTCAPFCGDDVRQASELCDGTDDALCPGQCSAGCTCPSSKLITFTVQAGADLDTGWTGTAHDLEVQKGSTISGELSNCDGVSDFVCDFFGNVGSACSADPGQACLSDGECSAGFCIINTFGPPLPLSAGGVPACIVNRFATDVTGTYNLQTGDARLNTRLNSLVHLGNQVSRPCPICDCGLPDPHDCQIGDTGTCTDVSGSPPCTVQGTGPLGPTSNSCLPSGSSNVSGGGLDIPFQPVTTGTSTFPSNQTCDGTGFTSAQCWCNGQPQPNSCLTACDGGSRDGLSCDSDANCPSAPAGACKTLCRQIVGQPVGEGECVAGPIVQTCAGAPEIGCQTNSNCPPGKGPCAAANQRCFLDPIVRIGSPSTTLNTSVATFCIPATSASAINSTAGLPGPGAISFPAAIDLKQCGDNVVNRFVEECDGTDDSNCPGACLANCTCTQSCGNNVIEFGEQCDGTSDAACPGQCGAPATPEACFCPTVCGDGFIAPTEECDPPNDQQCPGQCTNCTCPVPTATCLNGILDPGEPCEVPGLGCGPSQACLLCQQCFPPYEAITPYLGFICGNQIQEPTEFCELPAVGCNAGQLCLNCTQCVDAIPFCGNQNIEPGEICELPAIGCAQHQLCSLCTQCIDVPISICGNGVIEDGEVCELPQTGCGPLAVCLLCTQCVPLL